MIIPNNYKWILKNKTILCISLGFVLMAGFIPMLSFSEMKATPSNSTSVSAVTSFSDDVETIVSSDTSTKPKKDTPLDAKRKIKFDEGFYDQIQEKIKTKNEFHQCLDEIGNFSNDEIFVYDSNSTTYENSKIVNKYEKIKDKPKCQKLLIAEENEPNKTIGNLIDKTDYHHVIIAVSKQDGTDRNPKIISQENKEDLEEVLRHTHGAKDIYVAERLSFISARIPTSEIPKIADHGNIVFRAGDGEQKVFQSATTIEQAKHIIHSDSVGTLPPFPFRGHGVTVSVIDNPGILNTTGLVNPTPTVSSHPDLPYGLDQTVIEVTSCSNGVCTNAITRESGSHSIGIASIIAGQGIVANAGVAPSAKLLDVAISQNQGITDPVHTTATVGNFVNAFDWSIRNGADLANISISPLTGCHEYNTFGILIDEAIDEGMLIITSVGNISSVRATVDDIACPYNNIAVGSVDANSIIAYDSLHGPAIYNQVQPDRRLKPELVAPGVDIFMADENDEYSTGSGTSFAAPFVTAAAALIKDSAAAPYYTPLETKVTLLLGAKWDPQGLIPFLRYPITAEGYEALGNTNPTDVVYTTLNSYGFGLLNVEKSLTYAKIKDEIEDGQFSLNHIIRDTIHQDETKPYTFYVSTADVGKETKIILSWFSQPMTDVFAPYPSIVPTPISNLNLQIYSPASTITPIISSNSLYQNNEFIVFKPTVQGLYTVKVIGTFVDIAQINEERFVIGSTIPFNIPPSNNSPTIYQFDSDIAVDYIGSGFNEVHIWLTGDDTNNDILSFFTVFEPTHGKLSPPLKQDRNSARVIYQPGPTFTGSDFFSFSAFDGKTFVNGPGTPVDLKAENIIPTSTQQDGLSSPPGIIDTGSAKFFRTEIKQTILSFPQPGQISALYVISDVPATLSFETTGTSYVSLSANSGKLIDFTNSQGITPTNIKIAAQNTVDANSVWIGYDTDTEDSPSPPNVTIGDTIVHTGPHDNYAILTITRSNNNNAMSVDYSTNGGSLYYPPTSGTVYFEAGGPLTKNIVVYTYGHESMLRVIIGYFVNLSNCIGCNITDSQGYVWVQDSAYGSTVRRIEINDVTLEEGTSGIRNLVFTVTRTHNDVATSVNYSTVDYTATVSSDYSPTSGILNFAVGGPLSQTISVPIVTDATVESNEIFFVQLSNCVGCTTGGSSSYITDPQGMGTITNDDGPPSITINDVTLSEGNFGTRNFTFDITRSSNTNDVSVVYMPADSTANTPMDFTAIPTTLYFAAGGPLTHTVAVPVVGDMTVEPDETFYVNLSNCEGCNISDLQGMSTITNDDSAPATHMSDTTANTGQSVYSGRPIHAEYVSSTSQLVGDIIDTITIKLKKSGSPTGTAEIGVFNTDLSVKKSFGTKDVSTLTTSYTDYTLSLTGQTYQIQSGDRIGIKYTGGDSSTNISIMRDTTAADPFDGTNSYHTYYDTTWRVYTSNDLYMILIQSSSGTADIVAPITTPSPSGGTYTSVQSVTLTANEAATIYYTTNGSTPTTTSTVYTTAIPITTTTMLKFFAKDNAGNSESVKTQVYTIDSTAPTTTALPLGGTYTTAKSITLTVNEAANIYYTTDGSTPTISSTIYTTQIQISTTTTLKFFAQDAAGNSESVQTQVYIISAGSPITHMSDTTANTGQSVYSGRPIHAEYVSATSQLIGDTIDTITIKLKKNGSPTGTAEIGIFNADLTVKQLFATKDVSTLTTSYTDYTFSSSGQTYQIQSGDRIGVKYTGGDSSTNISIMRDTDVADPFDGANSYHVYYQTSWSSFTANDIYMILVQSNP